MRRLLLTGGGALLWLALWRVPWQSWLMPLPVLRFGISLAMFLAPGWALHRLLGGRDEPGAVLVRSFVYALAVAGTVGFAACVTGMSAAQARWAYAGAGLVLLVVMRGRRQDEVSSEQPPGGLPGLLAGVTILLVARLALVPGIASSDDLTYFAHVTKFQQAEALDFRDQIFGIGPLSPRFWLAYWPFSQALIAAKAGMHGLESSGVYLKPVLAMLALLSVGQLARSLGMTRRLAALAVVAHGAALMLLIELDQVGYMLCNRLMEDKVMGAAVVAPCFLGAVLEFLHRGGRRPALIAGLSGLGLLWTHPTILAISCLIAGLTALLQVLATRQVRAPLGVLALAALLCAPPLLIRVQFKASTSQKLHFSLDSASAEDELGDYRRRRLNLVPDSRAYGVAQELVHEPPFFLLLGAAALGLVQLRRRRSARFVAAAGVVMLLAVVPATGWILGLAITPFHLWRVLWLAPFGVAAAFLVEAGWPLLRRKEDAVISAGLVSALGMLLLVGSTFALRQEATPEQLHSLELPDDWRGTLHSYTRNPDAGDEECPASYPQLRRMARYLQGQIDPGAVVVGDFHMNNLIPALSVNARVVSFREKNWMAPILTGITRDQAQQRFEDLKALTARDGNTAERQRVLKEYQVQYLLLCGEPGGRHGTTGWLRYFLRKGSEPRARLLRRFGPLHLYALKYPPGP